MGWAGGRRAEFSPGPAAKVSAMLPQRGAPIHSDFVPFALRQSTVPKRAVCAVVAGSAWTVPGAVVSGLPQSVRAGERQAAAAPMPAVRNEIPGFLIFLIREGRPGLYTALIAADLLRCVLRV
ncbi:putative protein OS=Streptomyces aurantiogriseus OX=66870 GN=GCM10010251_47320 PE=4 SV=1 [Streptomyces aurantiogriseus]|uniref:Uncharacterized protein n=1 Tax=Streptomyces aurantiogriseus TaxID=66870 RepID=A0A918CIL3_9ACTN|nr:hypothetical protein GCM10010251_47320 [Streptomyces aurantiogriseus]